MTEQPQPQQGTVLAVHVSQLSRETMATLVEQGYSILPDQTGWLVFVRVAQQQPDSGDGA